MNSSNGTIIVDSGAAGGWRRRDTLGVYLREARFQFLHTLRLPSFALPTLLFPVMFYLFFGVLFGHGAHGAYFLTAYGTFGVMAPGLFGFGVAIAVERERGILALKRVFPLPTLAYFFGRVVMSTLFALLIMLTLSIMAATLTDTTLTAARWIALNGTLVAGTIPFCALGLAVGLYVSGQAAPAVINMIYLPMAFLSGLWIPIQMLPHFLQQFAVCLPAYHLNQIALAIAGLGNGGSIAVHVSYLAIFSAVCLFIATRAWRRIQDR
ncbi:MAG TPA: ABC transporter permease [Gammaproteobacteria bacterium]|nr:ABC transporter permease [Gammaproteobacteria bacterium]